MSSIVDSVYQRRDASITTTKPITSICPNRSLGQSFLLNEATLDREIDYTAVGRSDRVLEIGPGPGTLTGRLASRAGHVTCIEFDRRFEPQLTTLAERHGNVGVIWGDATEIALPPFDRCVANLPYRVSIPIIFRLLDHHFHTAVVIIQLRQARRLVARPGQSGYGRLSVLVQRRASLRLLEIIKAENFWPRPKVDSAMLRIRPLRNPPPVSDEQRFSAFLDFAFVQRNARMSEVISSLSPSHLAKACVSSLPCSLCKNTVAQTTVVHLTRLVNVITDFGLKIPTVTKAQKQKAQKVWPSNDSPKLRRSMGRLVTRGKKNSRQK